MKFLPKYKLIILCFTLAFILVGCTQDEEAIEFKEDVETQLAIKSAIENVILEEYQLLAEVSLSQFDFTYPEGKLYLPLKTGKRLEVPVTVIGDPVYTFTAYVDIYDEEREEYRFDGNKDAINIKELEGFGTYVMEHLFQIKHEKALQHLESVAPDADISFDVNRDFSKRFSRDEKLEQRLYAQFTKDYHAHKFADATDYDELYELYAEKPDKDDQDYEKLTSSAETCTATISLYVKADSKKDSLIDEQIDSIKQAIIDDKSMPNGKYNIWTVVDDQQEIADSFLICK